MSSRLSIATGTLLLIGSTAVLLAASTLVGCGGSNGYGSSMNPAAPSQTYGGNNTTTTTAADVTIAIVGMNGSLSYSPNPGAVKVGQTVAWRNADSVAHTATADGGAFDTGTIAVGGTSAPITMGTAGSFPYHCTIHGFSMTGTLVVSQ